METKFREKFKIEAGFFIVLEMILRSIEMIVNYLRLIV